MTMEMNRREAMAVMTTSLAGLSAVGWSTTQPVPSLVEAHDRSLERALDAQVTDPRSRWCGASPDAWGLYHCGSAGRILRDGAAAYFHAQSRLHGSAALLERMKLAAGFLKRSQSTDGNIDLLTTNFNSPPDTGFVVHNVGTAARLAQVHQHDGLLSALEPFLLRAGQGMAQGGIHTPNHRWVVCAALAQIHELFPNPLFLKRIDQWLAEGVDIDAEGQFIERSTTVYNAVSNNALVVMAHKLKRNELLEPVRRNLDAMAYLVHPNGEVVTEISRRQDMNTRGTLASYWFCLRYMAVQDSNGLYATMLDRVEARHARLAAMMEYPSLHKALPPRKPLPDNYEKQYPLSGISRIRRGKTSATILHRQSSRFLSIHHGQAVVNAVRLATAFFGKGQFVPSFFARRDGAYHFKQTLEGPYYQPLSDGDLLPVQRDKWSSLRGKRERSEICRMTYEAQIRECAQGFDIGFSALGTANVPVALEINLRAGGESEGLLPAPKVEDAFLLKNGYATYRMGGDVIRIGPGQCEHAYTQVRGAQPKLPGPSVYITGYTPFEYTLSFQLMG
jgi:hypothetical protein